MVAVIASLLMALNRPMSVNCPVSKVFHRTVFDGRSAGVFLLVVWPTVTMCEPLVSVVAEESDAVVTCGV